MADKRHHSSSSSGSTSSSPVAEVPVSPPKPAFAIEIFKHVMTVYVADCYGIEIPGTEFDITMTITKETIPVQADFGLELITRVSLHLPAIAFLTGPYANNAVEINNPVSEIIDEVPGIFLPPTQNGGYLYTKKGYLPKNLRPNDVLTRAWLAASNNGQNIPFHYIDNPNPPPDETGITYTPPQAAYIIRITNSGGLAIEGTGTFANIIPPGTQQILATDLPAYLVKPNLRLSENTRISTEPINIVQYTLTAATVNTGNADNVRDSHINDAWNDIVAFAWTDNSNIPNAAANPGLMNIAYAIGCIEKGKLCLPKVKFLPNVLSQFSWDTSIAINRKNDKNIVLSYLLIDNNSPADGLPAATVCAAVSFDGGQTFPINGPINIQPSGFIVPGVPGGAGDNPGVQADKFGNFWYGSSNLFDSSGNFTNVPFIMISSDCGRTWSIAYTLAYDASNPVALYDFPEFCFGGDGQGNYGLQLVVDYFPGFDLGEADGYPARVFLPITGLGSYGTAQQTFLPAFLSNNFTASIAASEDGRVWTYGSASGLGPGGYAFPGGFTNNRVIYKSPGPIDQNYAGPWGVIRYNSLNDSIYYPVWEAAPYFGFFQTVRNVVYDEKRKALYVTLNATYPELSNNTRIYLVISRNNGLTWSNPIDVNTDDKNNRGFTSMALDTKKGHLVFGWYDCRDFKSGVDFNYWGTIIDSCRLDQLVAELPASNPVFSVPPAGYDVVPPEPITTLRSGKLAAPPAAAKPKTPVLSVAAKKKTLARLAAKFGSRVKKAAKSNKP